MSSKKPLIVGIGLALAAVVVYFAVFHDSGGEIDRTGKPVKPVAQPQTKVDESRPIAQAEPVRTPQTRSQAGAIVDAINGGVEGVVTDPTGTPVVGARVELVTAPGIGFALALQGATKQKPDAKVYSTSTGADGRYRLAAPPAENWKLTATHPDYRREEHLNIATPSDSYLTFPIQMRKGVRLYGRVTEDQKSMPVVGAIVVLNDTPVSPGFPTAIDDRRETTTDSSGQFRFENLRPGRHSLSVRAQTYGTKDYAVINVPEETTWRFDVKMAPGRNISGRVVDSNSHAVANARVSATTAGLGTSHGLANTNELGEFVLMDLDDGKYFLTADAGDAGQGRTDASQPVPAGAVDIEVKLTARCGAQGSVKDKVSGQPIAKFSVEVRRGSQNTKAPREIGPFAFADRKDGTFEIFGMDPVGEHVLYVTAEGFAPGYSERFTVQPGQTTRGVDVILAPGGTIVGKVIDTRNNQPVPGASVRTRDNDWNDISSVPLFGQLLGNLPSKTADITVTTDSEGRFEIPHVPEGTIQIQITHPQFIPLQQRDLAVTDGGKTEAGILRMSVGAAVKGTVFGADGAPAANAEVRIQNKPSLGGSIKGIVSKTVRCDAQGKYAIKSLPAGDYMIHALAGNVENAFEKLARGQKSRKEITLIENSEQEVDIFLTN